MSKIYKILIILILLVLIITPNVFASDIGSILQSGKEFLQVGDDPETTINLEKLIKSNSNIFNIFFAVAIIIAVVIGIILGIQFMTASVEGQAKVKEAVVPYLIGCVIVFAAFPIWKIVVGVGESTEKEIFTAEEGEKNAYDFLMQIANNEGSVREVLEEYLSVEENSDFKKAYKEKLYIFLTGDILSQRCANLGDLDPGWRSKNTVKGAVEDMLELCELYDKILTKEEYYEAIEMQIDSTYIIFEEWCKIEVLPNLVETSF